MDKFIFINIGYCTLYHHSANSHYPPCLYIMEWVDSLSIGFWHGELTWLEQCKCGRRNYEFPVKKLQIFCLAIWELNYKHEKKFSLVAIAPSCWVHNETHRKNPFTPFEGWSGVLEMNHRWPAAWNGMAYTNA